MKARGFSSGTVHPGSHYVGFRPLYRLGHADGADLVVGERNGRLGIIKRVQRRRTGFAAFRQLLLTEARIAAQLRHHNIVPLLGAEETESGVGLVYDKPRGHDLAFLTHILDRRDEALPLELAVHFVTETAQAVAFIHKRVGGLVRNLTAENVHVTKGGGIQIATMKLGLSRGRRATNEHDRGEIVELGRLLYMMLGARAPERGKPLDLHQLKVEGVPAHLNRVIACATHPVSGERYRSVMAMLADLRVWQRQQAMAFTPSVVAAFFRQNNLVTREIPRIPIPRAIQSRTTTEVFSCGFDESEKTILQVDWEAMQREVERRRHRHSLLEDVSSYES